MSDRIPGSDKPCRRCPFAPGRELEGVSNVVEYVHWDHEGATSAPFKLCHGRERACELGKAPHPERVVRIHEVPLPRSTFEKRESDRPRHLMQRPPRIKPVPKRDPHPDADALAMTLRTVAPKADLAALRQVGLLGDLSSEAQPESKPKPKPPAKIEETPPSPIAEDDETEAERCQQIRLF